MTIQEQIDLAIWISSNREVVDSVEKIADDHAVNFAVWLNKNKKNYKGIFIEELLEIYKKEKGL